MTFSTISLITETAVDRVKAILGLNCPEIHVCGGMEGSALVEAMANEVRTEMLTESNLPRGIFRGKVVRHRAANLQAT